MENNELKTIIRTAALKNNIDGVMALTRLVKKEKGLNYERISRVWHGSTNAKLCDVSDVADTLGLKIKFVSKGE